MRIIALVLLLVILPSAGSAVKIELSPVSAGVPVNVTVRDLPDGARFTLLTEAVCTAPPGLPLVFELSSFRMPFSLQGGGITTSASNARWVKFEAKLGNVTAGLETSPGSGEFSHREARNISPGTYEVIRLSALPQEPGDPVTTRIELSGNKTGPKDSLISFVPGGVTSCDLHLVVIVNDTRVFEETVALGNGSVTHEAGVVSADGVATLSGKGITGAWFVTGEKPAGVPDRWTALSRSYRLFAGTMLPPGTALVLQVPDRANADNYTLFLAVSRDGGWTMLPSRTEMTSSGPVILADITGPGTFALMGIEQTASPTTSPAPTKAAIPAIVPAAALAVFLIFSGRKR